MSDTNEQEEESNESHPAEANALGPASILQLEQTGKNGANWFYWIAGLSLINTALAHGGGNLHFIVGLSVTALADALAVELGKQQPENATLLSGAAIAFSLFVALVVWGFGWLSRKRILWVFAIGMGLYLLDGLVYLLLGDLMSAGFHAYALFGMFVGFRAFRQLNMLRDEEFYGDAEAEADE